MPMYLSGMVNTVWLTVAILANWRVSNALTEPEDGPFGIIHWIRHIVGVRYNELAEPYSENEIAAAFLCLWCLSMWVGIAQVALFALLGKYALLIMMPFAISGGTIVVDNVIARLSLES